MNPASSRRASSWSAARRARWTAFTALRVQPRTALVALGCFGLLGGAAGCDQSAARMEFVSANPADGRPETCPDDAVDPGGPGGGPMAARCSYDPGPDAHLVQLRGSVLLEGPGGEMPRPAEGMRVEVRRDDADGAVVGRSVTDAQGGFSVSVKGPPGAYVVRTLSEDTGETLAQRRFQVAESSRAVSGLDLLLPIDPALR